MLDKSKFIPTGKQKILLNEIKELIEIVGIDHDNLEDYEKDFITPHLERVKDHLIRSAVIMDYALIDEHLNMVLVNYFFGKKSQVIKLWKTKKFKNFNYFILEKLYLLNKLDLACEIISIPGDIVSDIRKLNDLRNGLAHTFFPENLRRNKPIYKGKSVYTMEGFRAYQADTEKANSFFVKVLYGIKN